MVGLGLGLVLGFIMPQSEQISRDSPTKSLSKWGVYTYLHARPSVSPSFGGLTPTCAAWTATEEAWGMLVSHFWTRREDQEVKMEASGWWFLNDKE